MHIASAGAWIGIDVVMGVVIFTALRGDDATRALCYQALELFAGWPLVVVGLVCLASGPCGGQLDLPADRLAERPAHRDDPGGIQAVGTDPQEPGADARRTVNDATAR
ncbi:MAG TPA: hypothetical protein VFH48_09325 [Chloroflexota bacterium]|nr:hypothetical protein [Chloroflexota bacterium]